MSKFLKEPFVHFILGGAILYVALALFAPDDGEESDPLTIEVSEERLLTYLQYQDKAFDGEQARRVLDSLDVQARQKLEDEYVRDEIMVREAMALGLDQNDDVIDQRLIQKMDFVFQGFAGADEPVTEAEISAYFDANKQAYEQEAQATFTHVFFKTEGQSLESAEAQAAEVLRTLQADNVPFEGAGEYGERFYFLKNYVNRPKSMIISHFGEDAMEVILGTEAFDTWFGPVRSSYGVHLVFVRAVQPARIPEIAEVADQVRMDVLRERRDALRRQEFEKVAQKYTVQRRAGH